MTRSDGSMRRLRSRSAIRTSSSEQREVMTGGRFDQIDYPTRVVA